MPEPTTLNRFPLFGLFCQRAALRMGKSESQAKLLGYSMAVLYAIFKTQAQRRSDGKAKKEKRALPDEARRAKTDTVYFGGHDFLVIKDGAERIRKSVVGHQVHEPDDYDRRVRDKFPGGWYGKLVKAFDRYLKPMKPAELNDAGRLYDLYKAWRDDCKVGRNRVDLNGLLGWLDDQRRTS